MRACSFRPRSVIPSFIVALAWAFASCGARAPGFRPGETVYWRVVSSEISFSNCSDNESFRKDLKPIEFDENTYIIYRVDDAGKTATSLSCQSFDPSSCRPSEAGLSFEIAGNELLYTSETKAPLQGKCNLQAVQSWVLVDKGATLDMEVSNVLSLVDGGDECETLENSVRAESPNGYGFQGCVVKYMVKAEFER